MIRDHLQRIAEAFAAGDFRLPGFVHAQEVPGTAVMAARRGSIVYTADTLPRGGQVRIRTDDPEAVRAHFVRLIGDLQRDRAGSHLHGDSATSP